MQPFGDLHPDAAGTKNSLMILPMPTVSSPPVAPSGTRTISSESEPMTTGAAFAKRDGRLVRAGQSFAANLKLAAGNRREGRHFTNLRAGFSGFAKGI